MAKPKYDISKHILVPKHVKVTAKELDKVLKEYNITVNELPRIFVKDAGIQELKPEVGDVIKVLRPSSTAKEIEFYRCVVDG